MSPITPPVLAIDLGGRRIKVGLIAGGEVLSLRVIDVIAEEGLVTHLADIEAAVSDASTEAGLSPADCAGLGIVTPGLVDPVAGRLLSTNRKYPDAVGFDFDDWSARAFALPVRLENDAHAALLGEWRHGSARGVRDVVMFTLGTGIGCSVILGGRPLRGHGHQAGLLGGHVVVEVGGRYCTCPGRGCAEAEASTWALPAIARADPEFSTSALAAEPAIDYRAVFRLAAAGDEVAGRLRDRSFAVWSAMAITLVNTFAPARIVLGGGVVHGAPELPGIIADYVNGHAWLSYGSVEVVAGDHLDTAALLGVAALFVQDVDYL